MNKFRKRLAIIMTYLMVITLLPTSFLAVTAKAEENVPKYLSYNELYFTSVAQYKDKTLVTYRGTKEDTKKVYTQLSLFQGGKETKIDEYDRASVNNDNKVKAGLYDGTSVHKEYDFTTGIISDITNKELLTDEVKNDIIQKINTKASTKYTAESAVFNAAYEMGDVDENQYIITMVSITEGVESPETSRYSIIYNKNNTFIGGKNEYLGFVINSDNNINVIDSENKVIKTIKNNEVINESKLNLQYESVYLINGDRIYTYVNNSIKEYLLKDGEYVVNKTITDIYAHGSISVDASGKNIWFVKKEADRNFVFKMENGEAVKKYEVSPNMKYLSVYDDNNLVVTSETGSTIINVATNEPNNEVNNTIDTEPTITNENGVTKVEVPAIISNSKNVVNVTGEDKKVEVNFKDIEAIKNGTGSAIINLNNGTKINIPFSLIDKTKLVGATNVKVKYDAIEDSDIVKGLKAVNKVFDFSLQIEYGDKVESIHTFADGVAEVTLQLTDVELKGLDKDKLKVLYYNEDTKKYEVMETKVDGNYITFKTSHFSKFIVAEVNDSGQPAVTSPKTGDANGVGSMAIGLIVLGSLFVVATMGYSYSKKSRKKC